MKNPFLSCAEMKVGVDIDAFSATTHAAEMTLIERLCLERVCPIIGVLADCLMPLDIVF